MPRISIKYQVAFATLLCCGALYWYSLPPQIFTAPYSTVLQASNGKLLSASIARDGQWRFPSKDTISDKFCEALIAFEDKRFYDHPGVDVLSFGRAIVQNIRERRIVSGGSTITMQVIRLSRRTRSRNFAEKIYEIILATRLELRHSKKEILLLYSAHAPFGGNVVGIEAACWRFFGRRPNDLSWGEAALLAVLPNAPSLMHPGKNRDILMNKRNRLLDKLFRSNKIDSLTWVLSKEESIPEKPRNLPKHASHLLQRMKKDGLSEKSLTSSIDYQLQQGVERAMNDHYQSLKANRIFNGAALVLDVKSGKVLAYIGNVVSDGSAHGNAVDIIGSRRSTGSILKPLLFAASLDEGAILPKTLLPDIPVFINGFSPKNFSKQYDGAVPADEALIRSLNVPSVFMLKEFRYEKFYTLLKNVGMTTLSQPPDHYGLSLILGGAEGTLWDITGTYASMARTLNNYFERPGKNRYSKSDFHEPYYDDRPGLAVHELEESALLSAASIYVTFEALKELYRPGEESGWKYFTTSKKIAWKTGTSFGFRDGWAIGVTPEYAVGVWVGNADGEGRPGLTGTATAAPILFDIFALLNGRSWFERPRSEMEEVVTCRKSGFKASALCEQVDTVWINRRPVENPVCKHHKTIHLSRDHKHQLHSACAPLASVIHVNWFVLPPVQEHYYKAKNISYKVLPPFHIACENTSSRQSMDLVYPKPNARIFIPRNFDGKPGSSIFELAHTDEKVAVFWHLDGVFIGSTKHTHRLAINPPEGLHVLTLIDEAGESLEERFTVISNM